MEKKLITVIIPTYNRKKKLLECISSILEQTYEHIEVLVVDDASTDGTEELFQRKTDPRLRYIRYETNRGACYARNCGAALAKGNCWPFRTVTICGILRSWRNSMHGFFPTKPICVSAG